MNVDEHVRTKLRDHADRVQVRMPPVDQFIAHRQRRQLGTAITVATVLVAVVALAMWATRVVPNLEVVDTPPGGAAVTLVDVTLLDGILVSKIRLEAVLTIRRPVPNPRRMEASLG